MLAVHEGPQNIGLRYTDTPMEGGNDYLQRTRFYCAGSHGIRIENLTLTKEWKTTEYGTFLEFETLTLCPIDTRPVVKELLLPEELKWLNDYNQAVRTALEPHLDETHRAFLKERTRAL